MTLYKQQDTEISTYLRTNNIILDNQLGQIPYIRFNEEKVLEVSGDVTTQHVGILQREFTPENAMTEFPLINPETLEPTGQMATYADVYAIIASLYIAMATERDADAL